MWKNTYRKTLGTRRPYLRALTASEMQDKITMSLFTPSITMRDEAGIKTFKRRTAKGVTVSVEQWEWKDD